MPPEYQVFNADPQVQPQRLAAYDYATLQPSTPVQALCLAAGGELHLPDGSIIPVSPGDWIFERPNGELLSVGAEEIADHWKFVDGTDEQEADFERTKTSVKNGRRAPTPVGNVPFNDPPHEPQAHPDGFVAAAERDVERQIEGGVPPTTVQERQGVKDAFAAQIARANERLVAVANVAVDRGIIDPEQANSWIASGIAPEGVHVAVDPTTGSMEVSRQTPPLSLSEPGDGDEALQGGEVSEQRELLEAKSIQDLWGDAKAAGITPEGTGKGGAVKKSDLVNALDAALRAQPEAD